MNEAHPTSQSTGYGEPGVIVEDLPCVNCAYNLRTLSTAGRCPECGAAVGETLALTHFDAAWLAELDRGIVTVRAGFMVLGVAALATVLVMAIDLAWPAISILFLASFVVLMCWTGGAHEITRPQPGAPDRSFLSPGPLAKAAIVASLVEFILVMVSPGFGISFLTEVLLLLLLTTMLAVTILMALHVANLARVFQRLDCLAPSRWVVVIGCASAVVMIGCVAFGVLGRQLASPQSILLIVANALFWVSLLLVICLGIAVLVMLHRFRRTLTYLSGLHTTAHERNEYDSGAGF